MAEKEEPSEENVEGLEEKEEYSEVNEAHSEAKEEFQEVKEAHIKEKEETSEEDTMTGMKMNICIRRWEEEECPWEAEET